MSTLPQRPAPSWRRPIAIGAAATVCLQMLPMLVASAAPIAAPFVLCCCAIEVLPIGYLPAVLALRRDPDLQPGQGFSVSFIAAGLGSVLIAALTALQTRAIDRAEYRAALRDALVKAREAAGAAASADDLAAVDQIADLVPYVSVVGACVITLAAGICGMATVRLLRRRAAGPPVPPPSVPPPSPDPPESPPE